MMKGMQQPAGGAGAAAVSADPFSPAAAAAAQAPVAAAAGGVQVLTPEQAAQALGVTVQDVVAELESGALKGRKIGAAWRISQDSLNEFLRG